MGLNTLTNRAAGQTILDTFFNDIHSAMNSDLVGRNSTGVPTASQNLGTVAIPWGVIRGSSLVLNGSAVDTSNIVSPQNRVISGAMRTTSNQPAFIIPNGAAASFVIDGTPVNLVLDVNGTEVTVSTDITKSSLTTAPASNNTCLSDDAAAADQFATKTWGETASAKHITVDNMGSNITALIGKWASFKVAGVTDEYFFAFVESATRLSKVFRGFFYNSSLAPINRSGFSNNDVITLMSTAWIFIENDATTVDVTYNNPVWSFTSPSSPATGDYWYDMGNNTWKRYDGASFQIINRTWVGMAILDSTNCVAARCTDFYANYRKDNDVEIEVQSTEIVRSRIPEARCNVAGYDIRFRLTLASWNITTDLASASDMYDATEQVSRIYYLYLKDDGDTVISDISPYYRLDLYGLYHPHNPWRAVGLANNDGSSNITFVNRFIIPRAVTQVFTSSSGTYTPTVTYPLPRSQHVRCIGGGGGGNGGGAGSTAGATGGATTFGTLSAGGGVTSGVFSTAGTGGVATGGDINIAGATGKNFIYITTSGGPGGNSYFGGSGSFGTAAAGPLAGAANTGGGGGGGGDGANAPGAGGGSGAYVEKRFLPALATASYSVGAGGVAGTGTSQGGSAGGSGIIIVEEEYDDILI